MLKHLLHLNAVFKCVAEWPNVDPGNKIPESNFDATGRTDDTPPYLGRTYDSTTDTFTALVGPIRSKRQILSDKAVWTPADRDEVLRIWLDPRRG